MKVCQACTYVNENAGLSCQVCGTIFAPAAEVEEDCSSTTTALIGKTKPCGKYEQWLVEIDYKQLFDVSEEHFDKLLTMIPQRIFATLRKAPFSLTPTRCSLFAYYLASFRTLDTCRKREEDRELKYEQDLEYAKALEIDQQNELERLRSLVDKPKQTESQLDNVSTPYSASLIANQDVQHTNASIDSSSTFEKETQRRDTDDVRRSRAEAYERLFQKQKRDQSS